MTRESRYISRLKGLTGGLSGSLSTLTVPSSSGADLAISRPISRAIVSERCASEARECASVSSDSRNSFISAFSWAVHGLAGALAAGGSSGRGRRWAVVAKRGG